jgi:hypothetical protein
MINQNKFILTPMADVITDVVNSSAGIGAGIETFPLCDYIMQSVFLKMTGLQEQKMKSVLWELASHDYDYRYLFTKASLGECSRYEDKQDIYRDLISQIVKRKSNFRISTEIDRSIILNETRIHIKSGFEGTNLSVWAQRSFDDYDQLWNQVKPSHFASDESTLFFSSKDNNSLSLKKIYEQHIYKNRNRIAHNSQSYQQNLPTLSTLVHNDYRYENYFFQFSVLILIDNLFVALFNKYLTVLKDYAY